ncbi:MAG TPA: hypothetical protein EYQ24_05485 [Bacteroidetes bacterium]|nr:hypothetical protein [Bacteroidota bacterium]
MTRFLLSLGLAVLGLLVLAGAVALLAYGPEPTRDGTLRLDGLSGEAELVWSPAGELTIRAADEPAMWTALGYAHAADHGWSMALWRQAALGQLSLWSGPEALPLDRHARSLGFGALAQESYRQLAAEDREAVDAYARGVRLAFADEAVAERDEFVQLDIEAAPWEPWHALAVERLIAWLGTAPLAEAVGEAEREFASADSLFRARLALGGLRHSRVYVAESRGDDTFQPGPVLVHHQPYGSSALPLLTGARVVLGGRERIVSTIPGTLWLPSSSSGWGLLLASDATLTRDAESLPPPVFSRLVDRDGGESLFRVLRDSAGLVLQQPSEAPRDTLAVDAVTGDPVLEAPRIEDLGVRLRWTGFRPGSDVGAFRALLSGQTPRFHLLNGDGLALRDGAVSPLGRPAVLREGLGWTFAAETDDALPATVRLAALAADRNAPDALAMDVGSPWAVRQVRALVLGLGNRDSLALELQDAYAFLRGWDGLYTPDAIAPTIAEAWINAHRDVFGRAPDPARSADSALAAYTFRIGLARLNDSLGTRPGGWTWDRFGGELRQPLLEGIDRYAPAPALGGGHPTSPLVGPSLILSAPSGPAVFSFWTDGATARTHHPALPVERRGRLDTRITRLWPAPSPDLPRLRLQPRS